MNLKNLIRWITLAALFIIPFLSLFVANTSFFPFITGKNFAFRILVEIAFVGWILLALVDKKYRPRFSWTAAIFGVFVVWMAIADALAVDPAKAFWSNFERMDGWVTLIHLFMLFLVMGSMLSADKLWRKWWFTFLGAAALVCAYGLLQVAGVLSIHQGGVRLDAAFGNSDYLACFLLFSIAISLWQAFEAKGKAWLRYGLLAFTVIEIIVLFLTATRGAILGLLGAAILGAVLWGIESGKQGRKYAGGAILILLVLIGGFFLVRNTSFIKNDPTLGRLATISLSDSETHTRIVIWHMALEGFVQKPITGWGQEGFNYVFNKYYEPQLYSQEPWFDRAHNMYLDWLVAGGAPALLLFLALLGSAVVALYRSNVSRAERVLFLSALAAYAFQGLFVFDNLFSYIPFVVILAMAHAASSKKIQKVEDIPVFGEADFLMYGLPVGAVVLVLMLWFVNVPGIRASGDLIEAITPSSDPVHTNLPAFQQAYADGSFANQEITEQLMTYAESIINDPSATNDVKEAIYTYAVQQTKSIVTAIPNDARIRLEAALLYRSAGDFTNSLAQIKVAAALSPNKQSILTEEGIEQVESGDTASAQATFDKAYQLDNTFTALAAYSAAGHILNGQIPQGKAILQQAYGTTTADQDILLIAYYQAKDYKDLIAVAQLRVKDQANSADSEFALAEAYSDASEFTEARAEIAEAIKEHPEASSEGTSILSQIPSK